MASLLLVTKEGRDLVRSEKKVKIAGKGGEKGGRWIRAAALTESMGMCGEERVGQF